MKPPIEARTGDPVRECILAMGAPSAGKSTNWKAIAQMMKAAGSTGTMYVVDTDGFAARKLLAAHPELDNIVVYRAREWTAFRDASKEIMKQAQVGDWVVVDFADAIWKFVQNYFSKTVFGAGLDDEYDEAEHLLALRAQWQREEAGKAKKDRQEKTPKRTSTEGWDWGYINDLYDSRMLPLILETPAHVYLTSAAVDLNSDLETDKMKRLLFGEIGVKPGGQKMLPHQVDTVMLQRVLSGDRVITTVKDRERELVKDAAIKDFVSGYLLPVAGWSLK